MTTLKIKKPRASLMLAVCVLLCSGCASTDTDTDPNKVSPTARLEVFSTGTKSFAAIDLIEDDTRHATPPGERDISAEVRGQTLIIRATGSQLNKGLGKLTLEVTAKSLKCVKVAADGGGTSADISTSALIPPTPIEAKGQGILSTNYNLSAALKRIRGCDIHGAGFNLNGDIELRLVVENIGKPTPRVTRTPPIVLHFSDFPTK